MRKTLGIVLIVIGLTFLVWKLLTLSMGFFPSLLLNIVGFIPISIGFAIVRKKKSVTEPENKEVYVKKNDEVVENKKIHAPDDHSKYMPK
jgi:uncharacterized membrane protein